MLPSHCHRFYVIEFFHVIKPHIQIGLMELNEKKTMQFVKCTISFRLVFSNYESTGVNSTALVNQNCIVQELSLTENFLFLFLFFFTFWFIVFTQNSKNWACLYYFVIMHTHYPYRSIQAISNDIKTRIFSFFCRIFFFFFCKNGINRPLLQ